MYYVLTYDITLSLGVNQLHAARSSIYIYIYIARAILAN